MRRRSEFRLSALGGTKSSATSAKPAASKDPDQEPDEEPGKARGKKPGNALGEEPGAFAASASELSCLWLACQFMA